MGRVPSWLVTLGGGLGGGSGDARHRAEASRFVERGGKQEFATPGYGVRFRSVLIVVFVMVALIVGAIVLFT